LSSGCGGSWKLPFSDPFAQGSPTGPANQKAAQSEAIPIDELKRTAESGDTKSQLALARRLRAGVGTQKNLVEACKWFERAATHGDVGGMTATALCYDGNRGIPRDSDRAAQWWLTAAEAGNAEAQFEFGKTKASVLRKGTEIFANGDEEAKQKAEDFLLWETRASDQGYSAAERLLGMTYLLGARRAGISLESLSVRGADAPVILIQPDPEKGVALLARAADLGDSISQWDLAVLYQVGFHAISPDKALSDKYWKLISEETKAVHQRWIASLYFQTDKDYTPGKNKYFGRSLSTYYETNDVAREWLEKAAAQGDVESMWRLGLIFRDGMTGPPNATKAVSYFKRAAERGDYKSMAALAVAYTDGTGVARNYEEAFKWAVAAANENETAPSSQVHKMRNAVGWSYENGYGTTKDLVLAYAWYNVSASGGDADAQQNVARLESLLSSEEIKEAQSLSSHWSPGQDMKRAQRIAATGSASSQPRPDGAGSSTLERQSVGSGFFISANGNVLTNNHVVGDCVEIRVPSENKTARLVVADVQNDLAVIKLDVTGKRTLVFTNGDAIKQGQDVYVFGFPLEGFLPASGNFTQGMVAALAGPGNNASLIQITAPIQPGNSGGPVLDYKGNVVAIVVGKADALKVAKATGDIPQNINFAIAPQTIQAFLNGNQVGYEAASGLFTFGKKAVDIAETARTGTVKIECWR
jgi:TPR repeat protein